MRRLLPFLPLAPLLLAGCVGVRSPAPAGGVARPAPVGASAYTVGCPDVLAVRFGTRPHLDCLAAVDLDGRLPVSEGVRPPVAGGTLDDARLAAAAAAGCDPDTVSVRLAEARTARVYLFGPEGNRLRVVPHMGAESLPDFLARTGSLQRGCTDPREVCVVRPNVAAGGRPEVFRADLQGSPAGDPAALRLEPGDQVYVGETRRSRFAHLLPGWLRGGYKKLVGIE